MSFVATWADLENITVSERKRKTCCMMSLICGIQKIVKMNLYANRNKLTDVENIFIDTERELRGTVIN